MKLIAPIPAYLPDAHLLQLTQSLLDRDFFAIVIVNDGSESEYNAVFETLSNISRVTVLDHVVNLGKGAALKRASIIFAEYGKMIQASSLSMRTESIKLMMS